MLPQSHFIAFNDIKSKHFSNALKDSWAGLHNSESSKGQIDQHKFAAGRKSLFRCNAEEILKEQLIVRSRAFAKFSTTEKAFPGRKKISRGS